VGPRGPARGRPVCSSLHELPSRTHRTQNLLDQSHKTASQLRSRPSSVPSRSGGTRIRHRECAGGSLQPSATDGSVLFLTLRGRWQRRSLPVRDATVPVSDRVRNAGGVADGGGQSAPMWKPSRRGGSSWVMEPPDPLRLAELGISPLRRGILARHLLTNQDCSWVG